MAKGKGEYKKRRGVGAKGRGQELELGRERNGSPPACLRRPPPIPQARAASGSARMVTFFKEIPTEPNLFDFIEDQSACGSVCS